MATGEEDIIDETIKFFRANVLFRNFDVKGGSDRTLIFLTLCVSQFLSECERATTKAEAEKSLQSIASKSISVPGESGWVLGGMYPPPKNAAEGESFKAYFKQCREEASHVPYLSVPSLNLFVILCS
jgi:actin related protein 2/3 complex subunit 3